MKEFFTTALKLAVENKCIDENDRVILSYDIFKKTREKIEPAKKDWQVLEDNHISMAN